MTYTAVAYVIPVVVLFFFISSLASALLLLKKIRWRFWKRKKGPTSAELRQRRIPVIESTPFWVPGIPSSLVGIEIQPSAQLLPVTYSTPKPRRHKLVRNSREKRRLFFRKEGTVFYNTCQNFAFTFSFAPVGRTLNKQLVKSLPFYFPEAWKRYRKIPKISPGAYIFQRPF